jgi:hypothetical protein
MVRSNDVILNKNRADAAPRKRKAAAIKSTSSSGTPAEVSDSSSGESECSSECDNDETDEG